MGAVHFYDVDAFIGEMQRDAPLIHRGIVRVTPFYKQSSTVPNIQYVSVVATFTIGERVTRLDIFCGEWWGKGFPDTAVRRAVDCQARLRAAVEALELEMRSGVFEEDLV